VRVAVIGAGGSMGKRHAANVVVLGHEAVSIDIAGGEFRKLSTRCGKLDAAIVATPADSHLELLRECIAWGLPVLVEKPVGRVEDIEALRALRPTQPVMIGYQLRFHPALQALKASVSHPDGGGFYLDCDMQTWPGQRYEHILLEGSHELDAALFCGAPSKVLDVAELTDTRATFRLGSAGRWLVGLDGACPEYHRHWSLAPPSDARPIEFHSPTELGDQMYVDELAHFLRAVEGGPTAPGCTLEEGIAVLAVIRQVRG
jgi:predicted dehydrogenase